MAFLDENGVSQLWAAVKDRLAGAFDSVEFDVAEQAANLVSGDSIATAFGKLAKNYSSLLTSISALNTNLTSQINTKLNKSDVLANYTTTATGKALDASLGPAIKTKMDLADTLNNRVDNIENRQIIVKNGAVENPAAASNVVITHIVLPANSGRWLLIGNLYHNNYGGEITELGIFTSAPNEQFYAGPCRTTTNSGGGLMTFAYATNSNNDRTINLVTYTYNVISVNYSIGGRIVAINLG